MILQAAFIGFALMICLAVSSILVRRKDLSFDLLPNQLLTRKPLVFLTGDRSIFYFTRYWNQIPSFLTEHGFEVYKAALPWKNGQPRSAHLEKLFLSWARQNFSCHLFIDPSLAAEITHFLGQNSSSVIASLTILGKDVSWEDPRKPPLYWRAHQLVTQTPTHFSHLGHGLHESLKSALLAHVKELAEQDFAMPN